MPDATLQRSPARRMRPRPTADGLLLEAEMVPAASRQDALDDALRLLASWAVRAARAQTAEAAGGPGPQQGPGAPRAVTQDDTPQGADEQCTS